METKSNRCLQKLLNRGRFFIILTVIGLVFGSAHQLMAATRPDDEAVRDALENQLAEDEIVPFDDIDVAVHEGIVTLTGSVANLLAKMRAVKIAQTVRGVRSVVDQIKVVPPLPRTDAEIEKDIEEALIFNAATETYEVEVDVQNSEAILSGTVDSWQEKMAAEKEAMKIRGVTAVVNKIKVKIQSDRSDPAIMADVKQALRWDVFVDPGLIDVRVKDREVILSGTVGSVAERNEAMANAWVAGVKSVDISDLEVSWWVPNEKNLRRDEFMVKSDADIRHAVEDALLYDPQVSAFKIEPRVRAGVVTLRGEVDHLKAKRAAGRDARNTVGVISVRNRIKVRPQAEISDRQIKDNVSAALIRDPYLYGFEIKVRAYDNTVYLNGEVNSFYQKAHADEIASGIRGVKSVKNNLTVNFAHVPYVTKPYLDEGNVSDYDWYDYRPAYALKRDIEIKVDIQDELFWSPFVDSDNIEVSVQNGVATLSGNVDTQAEKSMAEANAFEGGAIRVVNNLKVK